MFQTLKRYIILKPYLKQITNHRSSHKLTSDFKLKKNNNNSSLKFKKMVKIFLKTMNILEKSLNDAFN